MLLGHTKDPTWPAPEDALTEARRFMEQQRGKRVLVVPHSEVDGLASGVLIVRALEALGASGALRVPGKGEHAHSPGFLERVRASSPEALIVLAMGSRATPLLPTLVVDRHRDTEPLPAEVRLLSAHGHEPAASTSLLTYVLVSPLVVPGPLEWLAVLGTAGALGTDAPMPFLKDALRRANRKAVVETVSLVNAARRSARFAAPRALEVLLRARNAKDVADGHVPGVDELRDCRLEVRREVERCAKTPPRIATNVALLLFSSEALVHPLVAVRWAQRLPEHLVIAANTGYLPGHVDFALRSQATRDPMTLLQGLAPSALGDALTAGHAHATGGSLPQPDFLRFAEAVGLPGLSAQDVERRGAFPG
ncbi:DHH family phosphoesterase [Myxococcus sp. CA051A]|uniref:DHH family phosphoesterase n=1 Tax=Myxococcus sp. CA051A TaxID=2741739 RepID=UPI00157B65C1|nr:DHH family phosphoesterase [Myxococcus sp. CA051A]NTX62413.1 DHH family phosphoesterase [Myxococcus sp. CA051A]